MLYVLRLVITVYNILHDTAASGIFPTQSGEHASCARFFFFAKIYFLFTYSLKNCN
jgi:hypothetical protein